MSDSFDTYDKAAKQGPERKFIPAQSAMDELQGELASQERETARQIEITEMRQEYSRRIQAMQDDLDRKRSGRQLPTDVPAPCETPQFNPPIASCEPAPDLSATIREQDCQIQGLHKALDNCKAALDKCEAAPPKVQGQPTPGAKAYYPQRSEGELNWWILLTAILTLLLVIYLVLQPGWFSAGSDPAIGAPTPTPGITAPLNPKTPLSAKIKKLEGSNRWLRHLHKVERDRADVATQHNQIYAQRIRALTGPHSAKSTKRKKKLATKPDCVKK